MTRLEAIELAKQYFLEDILPDDCEPEVKPLVCEVFGNEDEGWEIQLLYAESYYFFVDEDTVDCTANSVSGSRFVRWYYPDARFNPDNGEGHAPL